MREQLLGRTIASHGGNDSAELNDFIPSVVARHPKYDYVLATELKHGTNSVERGLGIRNDGMANSSYHLILK